MSFSLDIRGHQPVNDDVSASHGEEIMFFGRAIEYADVGLQFQDQLTLPLFPFPDQPLRGLREQP